MCWAKSWLGGLRRTVPPGTVRRSGPGGAGLGRPYRLRSDEHLVAVIGDVCVEVEDVQAGYPPDALGHPVWG